MRSLDHTTLPAELTDPKITNFLTAIHEYRGRQELLLTAKPAALESLVDVARIQSTDASNRIEGISTSGTRLGQIVRGASEPTNRDEAQIAGYRDVLATIHQSYEHMPVTPSLILQLHRDLYRHTATSHAGAWKGVDNQIVEVAEDGTRRVRFTPVPAIATPQAMADLCQSLAQATQRADYDPLLALCLFVFDLTCIHPFTDGNGRMSRLLTLLVLYQQNYLVGRYVSIEAAIERTKETYYEALAASSEGWDEGRNTYAPFASYLLGVILGCYRDFEARVGSLTAARPRMSKPQRIEELLQRSAGKVTKADILWQLPDISATTAERALADLLSRGVIRKVGGGRSTGYVWVEYDS